MTSLHAFTAWVLIFESSLKRYFTSASSSKLKNVFLNENFKKNLFFNFQANALGYTVTRDEVLMLKVKNGATTFRIMPLSIMPLSIMPLSIVPLSIMQLSIMTLGIMGFTSTLYDVCYYECYYDE